MRISETVMDNDNGGALPTKNANLTEALKGNNAVGTTADSENTWSFGKIDGSRKRTSVADIELKIGYSYMDNDCCYFESYFGIQIPTSHRPNGEYVFEPLAGHNGHFALMTGWASAFQLWSSCDGEKTLYSEIEFNSRYFVSRNETRSFDLKEKPWSRYMPVYENQTAAENDTLTPGINVFTQELKVKPRFSHDINLGLVYNTCCFQGEVGWNFWARQAELVELKDPWLTGNNAPSIPDCCNPSTVNRARNIRENFTAVCLSSADADCSLVCQNANPDGTCTLIVPWQSATSTETYAPVTEQDLNLNSAAHPGAMSHTIYGSLGYKWDHWCYPPFVGIGGSYELTGENTALNRWMLWAKTGFSY